MQTSHDHQVVNASRSNGNGKVNLARSPFRNWRYRTAAVGKALIVYLFSGSLLTAAVAFLIFRGMGC